MARPLRDPRREYEHLAIEPEYRRSPDLELLNPGELVITADIPPAAAVRAMFAQFTVRYHLLRKRQTLTTTACWTGELWMLTKRRTGRAKAVAA